MLIKLGFRQILRQLKGNVFHLLTLSIIFMVTFVMTIYTFDTELINNLASSQAMKILNAYGGIGGVFRVFLFITLFINLFFLTYIFRLRLRENSKMYALYRLLGMRSKDLSFLYIFEIVIFTIISALVGGVIGIFVIRINKMFLLSLGSFVETNIEFTFSMSCYLIAVLLYFTCMIVAMLFSLVVIARADIILLFKREQLVQKTSKGTPFYAVAAIILLGILPYFTKGDEQTIFQNFALSFLIIVIGMYLLYKSGVTILFGIRRTLGLNKKHGSEFITGRFFFSQLNKSALMMTATSLFLIIVFFFAFINQSFTTNNSIRRATSDFSMLNASNEDIQQVEQALKDRNIKYNTNNFEYRLVLVDIQNNKLLSSAEIQQEFAKKASKKEDIEAFSKKYRSYFIFSEKNYTKNIEQLKQMNPEHLTAINHLYRLQKNEKSKLISGIIEENKTTLPIYVPEVVRNLPNERKEEMLQINFFDHPVLGITQSPILIYAESSSTFVIPNEEYKNLSTIGQTMQMKVFNTPNMTLRQYRKLYNETPLNKYTGVTTTGKKSVQLLNGETQAPILFSFYTIFFQILFYIIILVLYRLTDMMQKQYRIFQTLHIVGASTVTIIGAVAMQTFITLMFPIGVSFYVARIFVMGLFDKFYSQEAMSTMILANLPHIVIVFLIVTLGFIYYQSIIIRNQFKL